MVDVSVRASLPELRRLQPGRRRTLAAARALAQIAPPDAVATPSEMDLPAATSVLVAFQERVGLPATGDADDATIARVVAEVAHTHIASSRMRTAKVQDMLARAGFKPIAEERSTRTAGESTIGEVKRFQEQNGLTVDGLVGEVTLGALGQAALTATLATHRQTRTLQRALLKAASVRGVELHIDEAELRTRTAGDSTRAAVRILQESLGLPVTGEVDLTTFDRVRAVAASRRPKSKPVSAPQANEVRVVPRNLRLNMTNKDVATAQKALAFLGHAPTEAEFKAARFGKSTRQAVLAFQAAKRLPQTGALDAATRSAINSAIRIATPGPEFPHRIRGAVRDETWHGRGDITVELSTDPVAGESVVLATRRTLPTGFFDIPYEVPKDPASGQPISPLAIKVRYLDGGGNPIGVKRLLNPTATCWANFTEGAHPYRGTSLHQLLLAAVAKIGVTDMTALMETAGRADVSRVAAQAGLGQDDVMRLILAARAAGVLGGVLDAEVCFAFLAQNLPAGVPSDLLAQTHEWTLIEQLVDRVAVGVAFSEPALARSALETAVSENLVGVALGARLDTIMAEIAEARRRMALDRPLLVGNGTLRDTLKRTIVPEGTHAAIADAFALTGGMGPKFWHLLRENPDAYGGAGAVASLETGVEIGLVAKNHPPTVDLLAQRLDDPAHGELTTTRDLAKWDSEQWNQLVATVGSVPVNTDGDTDPARHATFARTMEAQAHRLFPTVALTASVKRTGAGGLTAVGDIEQLVDAHPGFELRTSSVDAFIAANAPQSKPEIRSELRVLQRVHRLAPTIETATALLDAGVHSSVQVLSLGPEAFAAKLASLKIDAPTIASMYGYAEIQYAQVLQRIGEFRSELQKTMPAALSPLVLTAELRSKVLKDIPDLESLFGALDACDCPHCASVYGPGAYLADILRFLTRAANTGGTVLKVLTDRRPDIVKIKLDCANTETVLPYIDLTNEVLESIYPGSAGLLDRQTTLPSDELRATPEHQDETVYDDLRVSDLPISSAYDLWQDQTRTLLTHLNVPRWRLMEIFRSAAAGPDAEVDAAAEYLAVSSHEAGLITTAKPATGDQSTLWGFDALRSSIPVLEVLERTKLSYLQLQMLLQNAWITPDGDPPIHIKRPASSADLNLQTVDGVSADALDRIHRVLRVWRHTPWDLWELGLLVRTERIGGDALDGPALKQLAAAARLGDRLKTGAQELATWFGVLPMMGHPAESDPTDLTAADASLYAKTFLRRAATGAPDPAFDPQPDGSDLRRHRPALLAALAIADPALTALLDRTGATNDLMTLSRLTAWVGLARGLRFNVPELLAAGDLLKPLVSDPFASPSTLLVFIELTDELRAAGLTITEQDFLLSSRPASPLAPTDEAVGLALGSLRESMRTAPAASPAGQVFTTIAAATGLVPAQAKALLDESDAVGKLLDAFLDPELLKRQPGGDFVHSAVTRTDFPRLFTVYRRILKMARVARALSLDTDKLAWTLQRGSALGLRLVDLPVDAAPDVPLGSGWVRLLRWSGAHRALDLRASIVSAPPGAAPAAPASTAGDLFAAAADGRPIDEIRGIATSLSGISTATLTQLDGGTAARYTDPQFLRRLADASDAVQRLGISSDVAATWSLRERQGGPPEREIAKAVMQAAKSKYERGAWLTVLGPLQDVWRERKRNALVAYLIENASRTQPPTVQVAGKEYPNPKRWTSTADLLDYLLIDVETNPPVLTSRIKHAIGSVQMFVQRAYLNLEKPHVVIKTDEKADLASPNSWRQWKWMKNYRIWEANRKIFLYPENWIEPELRDDKTPLFKEFEQELLSGEITAERSEGALRNYLTKLNEIANLEVVGVHHEIDDDHPWDNLGPSVNLLHVVGRTRGEPFTYFYRRYDVNASIWTPWETIDLDVTAEQVLPVVYNRTLHLFWLQFTEKPQKGKRQPAAQPSTGTTAAPEPPTQLEIKLSWTVRGRDGWSTKRTAPQTLVHPWPRPARSYTLKPRYHSAENQLWIDVYISMSYEFNQGWFWDPYLGYHRKLTSKSFDESARPWHSSSFVFDGHVTGLRLKPLRGFYHPIGSDGQPNPNLAASDSFNFVSGISDPQRRVMDRLTTTAQVSARLVQPPGMHLESGRMRSNSVTPNTGQLTVIQNGAEVALLQGARPPFGTVQSMHRIQLDTAADRSPFFYLDAARAYFVTSQWANVRIDSTTSVQRLQYTFAPFQHPYAALLLRELNRSGPDGVLNRAMQRFPASYPPGNAFDFSSYAPVGNVAVADPTAQKDILDFSRSGAMSVYNWEVFFHIPLLVGCRLSTNQRFEEALDWFHRIFDPSNTESESAPQRYWITKPFFEATDETYQQSRITEILGNADDPEIVKQITQWRNNPFMPDVIARFRPVAYQKAVVRKYLDALIAWGDQLFRRETIESINEATLLYVLAGELLGRRPEHVPAVPRDAKSYEELVAAEELDAFGNAQVEVQLENLTNRPTLVIGSDEPGALPVVRLSYFGIPANDALLAYWDTVADRLFKIRNSMDISGVFRQLPLFEPPIDPALLVRAAAMGIDLSSVLNPASAKGSPYRYATLFESARSCAEDVRALGERMLAILERRDADALERLRSGNEVAQETLVQRVREAQVLEAQRAREALENSTEAIQLRIDHYSAQPYMNDWETAATVAHALGIVSQIVATILGAVSGGASLAPSVTFGAAGFGGTPVATVTYGGENIADSASGFARVFEGVSGILHSAGGMLETQGGYQRRHEDNQFQAELARKELSRLAKEIVVAQVREAVSQHELDAHLHAVEAAQSVDEFLRSKYTGAELYEWTLGQLSTVYFQAYQLAYDRARQAEEAYRYETGDHTTPPVIQFGYWDSLRKGLLAGDRLVNDLRRLESIALENNRRRLEATTRVSLATLMPGKLLELKATGRTTIELPEWLFARENPGWYNQRIRWVAVDTPSVTGPYTGVHATVTLTQAVVRTSAQAGHDFGDAFAGGPGFAAAMPTIASIRTSHGVDDRGRLAGSAPDDRYEPFEGGGLISHWTIEMDPRDNAFDVDTLSDFVLTIAYEGDQGSSQLVAQARSAVSEAVPKRGAALIWLDGTHGAKWARFLHPSEGEEQQLRIPVGREVLTFLQRQHSGAKRLRVLGADLVAEVETSPLDVRMTPPSAAGGAAAARIEVAATTGGAFGELAHAPATWPAGQGPDLLGTWTLQFKRTADLTWDALPDDAVRHAWLLLRFEASDV
ncbi:peptidoglycan hydrolase-like protein with peptidoglycan-binding domain [Arthrobacter sp. SORGH_AS 212]|uniref:Tc toxin subunit A-related protein n=1 Tax=Pseudarthrobacter sp. SORGH_AS 212 TaxID=3041777 RepID=UPI002784006C|nr:peptidoglycan hydrolase-like protein with peptidoglycan-binding domain [Arthrobacter sp. SORGH_AS_0212]